MYRSLLRPLAVVAILTPLAPSVAGTLSLDEMKARYVRPTSIPFPADNPYSVAKAKLGEMLQRSGRRTVPQIFVGEHHVGGFDDLYALDHAGDLDPLLAD